MPETPEQQGAFPNNSVGLTEPQVFEFDEALELSCGRRLDSYRLVVETYGQLNEEKAMPC